MNDIDIKKNLFDALDGKRVTKVPVASFTQTGIVDLMELSNASWPLAHEDPHLMAELAMAAHDLIGFESVRVPYCVTVLAEALGCDLMMGKADKQPSVLSHPLSGLEKDLEVPERLLEIGRIPVVLDAIGKVRERMGEDVPIIAGFEGPCTLASDLIGAEKFLISFIKKPEYVASVIRSSTEACIEYSNSLLEAGADIICVADPVASPELISPKIFESHVMENLKNIAKCSKGRSVLHICGNVYKILDSMSRCGYDALSVEEKISDIGKAKELISGRSRLVGNVACATTLFNGTPEDVKEEAMNAMKNGIDVLAPGCGLAPKTPIENARALIEARNDYYQ
ncbi:MAG TPA: methylcobamide:CoM methyltransferase MtaA [Candidatus Methanofastidiosa archaeon]|nr:methylcobamide:CoM methyltransferase MtaA [Candidatus Methanofastidiosa archaeon]HPR41454.1 methylcobamide:CoM methyltransferase MtaA [Candidatus Methanofastidiosa archaeon]